LPSSVFFFYLVKNVSIAIQDDKTIATNEKMNNEQCREKILKYTSIAQSKQETKNYHSHLQLNILILHGLGKNNQIFITWSRRK